MTPTFGIVGVTIDSRVPGGRLTNVFRSNILLITRLLLSNYLSSAMEQISRGYRRQTAHSRSFTTH